MAVNAKGEEITSIWTPANIVTCVRILFIPLFMIASEFAFSGFAAGGNHFGITAGAWAVAAFVLYFVLSATDKIDGDLARKRGEVTDFGKFLDPIADKLLVFSALLILLEHGLVNVWFVFIILLREFLVSALRMVASANGEVIAADNLGKAKDRGHHGIAMRVPARYRARVPRASRHGSGHLHRAHGRMGDDGRRGRAHGRLGRTVLLERPSRHFPRVAFFLIDPRKRAGFHARLPGGCLVSPGGVPS